MSAAVRGAEQAVAIVMALFTMVNIQFFFLSFVPLINIFLSLALLIVFLGSDAVGTGSPLRRGLMALLLIGTAGAGLYVHVNETALLDRLGAPTRADFWVGVVVILLVLEAARRAYGWTLFILGIVALAYGLTGPLFPGIFAHAGLDLGRLVAVLTTDLDSIYGDLVNIAATYVAVFFIFGGCLQYLGGASVFIQLPLALVRRSRACGAYGAVIGSGLVGMASGSPTANVVTVGTFTIPLMKRAGFPAHVAGGIEAATSTGGQIMPPVMGAVAFVMAENLSTPYAQIIRYAIVPALLYYLTIGIHVYFKVQRMNLTRMSTEEIPPAGELFRRGWRHFLPLLVLIYFLVAGYSPGFAAFYAVIAALIVAIPRRDVRGYLRNVWQAILEGGRRSAELAVALACIAIFVKIVVVTGLGLKFTSLMLDLARGHLLIALLLTAFTLAVLGCEIPTVGAYILVAVVAPPVLVGLGARPLEAHFFILYFSVLAAMTPPVALAALAAAKLAEADYFKTGWASIQFGIVAYIVPFLFVYQPALLTVGHPLRIIWYTALTVVAFATLSASWQGYLTRPLVAWERLLLLPVVAFLFLYIARRDMQWLALGGGILALFLLLYAIALRRPVPAPEGPLRG